MSALPRPSEQHTQTPSEKLAAGIFGDPNSATAKAMAATAEARAAGRLGGPSGPKPPDDREKTIHNERTKLSATFVNGLSIAFVVAGSVTFATNATNLPTPADVALRSLVWILVGIGLHWIGRTILGSLR